MKKIIASLLAAGSIILLCGVTNTYAEKDMGYIDLNFCDGSNHLNVVMGSGNQQGTGGEIGTGTNLGTGSYEICMLFKNDGNETMSIGIDVVEGSVAYGEVATQACKTTGDGYFSKNLTFSGDRIVSIDAHQTVEKRAIFTPPQGFAGIVHGCITYRLVEEGPAEEGMLSIISRKANLIDITVPGEAKSNFHLVPINSVPGNEGGVFTQYGKPIVDTEEIKILYNREENVITSIAGLKNDGFIGEEYIVKGTVYSLFGLIKKEFTAPQAQLYADSSTVNQHRMMVPWYQGLITVKWKIEHRPEELLGKVSDRQYIDRSFTTFIIPWKVIIILGGLLFLWILWRLIFRKWFRLLRSIKITVKEESVTQKSVSAATVASSEEEKKTESVAKAPRKMPVRKKTTTTAAKKAPAKKVAKEPTEKKTKKSP